MLKRIIAIAVLPMALALSAGCSKDAAVATVNGKSVSYSVKVQDSKATLVNSEEAFRTTPGIFTCNAYDNGSSIYKSGDITVKYSNSKWTPSKDATWERDHTLTFYAVANGTGTISSTGISCSHTIAATAEEQSDLMFGTYSGKGTEGKADISFSHPLTAVRFKMGDIATYVPGFTAITGISIEGVAAGGSIDWPKESDWTPTTFDKTVTLGVATTPEEGSLIEDGEAFALIPQTLTDHSAKISVSYTYTDGTPKTGAIVANISSGSWASGQSYTYTVNFKTLVLTIDDSGAVSEWATETGGTVEAEDVAPSYVEIGGLKWYKCNLGAEKETETGKYFAWGDTGGQKPVGSSFATSFDWAHAPFNNGSEYFNAAYFTQHKSEWLDGNETDGYKLKPEYDAAHAALGGGWHMPTSDEFSALYFACVNGMYDTGTYEVAPVGASTTFPKGVYWCGNYDGVRGCVFCDGTNKVFFPAAGYGTGTSLVDGEGFYCSSLLSINSESWDYAYVFFFNAASFNQKTYGEPRCIGYPVRPVSDIN